MAASQLHSTIQASQKACYDGSVLTVLCEKQEMSGKSETITTENNSNEGNKLNTKRNDYLEWEDYFISVAFLSAQRSKDPNTQVGACIVNNEKRIVGVGYNGMPTGCSDDILPWSRDGDTYLDTKHAYVCHAELNAVLNKNSSDVRGCTIYVALFPCNECAKVIIQSGIREVVYYSDKYHDRVETKAAKRMFELAGVKYRNHRPKKSKIVIDFESVEKSISIPSGHKLSDRWSKKNGE